MTVFIWRIFSMKLTTMEISRLQTAKSLSLLTKMRFNAYFWSPLEDDSDLPPLTWPLTRKTTPKPPSAMVSSAWTTCRPTVQDPPWKKKIVKLKNSKQNWGIIWNSKLSGKNRQIKAVLSCFTYDRSILTSNFHLFFVLTITWEEMLILGLVNKFVFLIIFFRLSRFRNLKTLWIFFCWNLMFIYNFLKKLRCFSGAKKT